MSHQLIIVSHSPAAPYQVIVIPAGSGNAYQVDSETETLLTCGVNTDGTVSRDLANWCVVEELPGEIANTMLDIVRVLAPNPFKVIQRIALV
jgi:hypothetical protein